MNLRDAGFVPALSTALLPRGSLALADFGVPLDLACWLAPFFIFGVVPLLDELCGTERYNAPSDAQLAALESRLYFRMLTMLVVPVWLATLVWCTWQFTQLPLGLVGKLGWLVSTSLIGGVLAINPAHELIHKPGRLEPLLGGILPTSAGYQGFKVEHVRGHHVHVATAHDSSSARLGESVYAFVPRALWLNVRNAWRTGGRAAARTWPAGMVMAQRDDPLERALMRLDAGLRQPGRPCGAAVLPGPGRDCRRHARSDQLHRTLRPLSPTARARALRTRHSPAFLEFTAQRCTNWLLFNLQRHSDHHEVARRRYQALVHHEDSPQLPAGYASMFVLALLPPLSRRVMDHRAMAAGR